ncbi:MAG: ATP-binding cassette domain-containing protein [Anaerolineales bacterium]|nr:ATP-binding cassette domain-containing protein [Anaerolineales bacterium]
MEPLNKQSPIIRVNKLRKVYTIHEREAGMAAAFRSLVKRKTRDIKAVDAIEFDIYPGEIVGFLGPNGAGKTTTLKMLTGLLHPTDGQAAVLGFTPWQRQKDFLQQITLVMGQRNQLVWDIPAIDSYELNRAIYHIPQDEYRQTLDELVELLDLALLMHKPVRNLSLGERMKCEIAAALLHRPQVLFLDEPTIGLDVTAQRKIRQFIREYNWRHGAAVMLTSHYMADVEALCKRVIVIHHGRLLFDGALSDLVLRFAAHKTIVVDLLPGATGGRGEAALRPFGELVSYTDGQATLRVPKAETAAVTSRLLAELSVQDLTIQDPPIEDVIEQVFDAGSEEVSSVK